MFSSALVLDCGAFWSQLDLGGGRTRTDIAMSALDNLMWRPDFWHFSSWGALHQGGFQEAVSGRHAITVLARLHLFCRGAYSFWDSLSQYVWPGSWTSCWWSKLFSSMAYSAVHTRASLLCSSPISGLVSSFCFCNDIEEFSSTMHKADNWEVNILPYDAQREIIGWQTFDWQWRLAAVLNMSAL